MTDLKMCLLVWNIWKKYIHFNQTVWTLFNDKPKIKTNLMAKNPVLSFVVITNHSSLFIITYSCSPQHHPGLYDKEALIYVWGAPGER